MEKITWRLFTL